MSFPKALTSLSLAGLSLSSAGSLAQAQAAPRTAYTITQAVAGSPGSTLTIQRNGSKVLTVMNQSAQGDTPASRTLTLYDLQAHSTLSWNPSSHPPACSTGTFSGDWGDPFGMSAEIASGVAKGQLKPAGTEMAGGVSTEVYTGGNAQATTKAWFDKADGLVMRAVITAPGSAPMTLVDIRKVSFAAPPAS